MSRKIVVGHKRLEMVNFERTHYEVRDEWTGWTIVVFSSYTHDLAIMQAKQQIKKVEQYYKNLGELSLYGTDDRGTLRYISHIDI